MTFEFIQPGKPTQNSYIERFNRTYREEVLDLYVFSRLSEVRDIMDRWFKEYNEQRSHEALGHLTPAEFLAVPRAAARRAARRLAGAPPGHPIVHHLAREASLPPQTAHRHILERLRAHAATEHPFLPPTTS